MTPREDADSRPLRGESASDRGTRDSFRVQGNRGRADDGIRTHDLLHGKRVAGLAPIRGQGAWLSGSQPPRRFAPSLAYRRRFQAIPCGLGTEPLLCPFQLRGLAPTVGS
jgi:hypothetical protein